MAKLKLRSAVLCEEVRREANGNAIIVGASMKGPEVKNKEETTLSRVGLYLEASLQEISTVGVRLWSDEYETSVFETKFDFSEHGLPELPPNTEPDDVEVLVVMVINKTSVKIPGAGIYDLQLKINKKPEWKGYRTFLFPSPEWEKEHDAQTVGPG